MALFAGAYAVAQVLYFPILYHLAASFFIVFYTGHQLQRRQWSPLVGLDGAPHHDLHLDRFVRLPRCCELIRDVYQASTLFIFAPRSRDSAFHGSELDFSRCALIPKYPPIPLTSIFTR